MIPSRLHSARKNKRWQIVTLLGAVLFLVLGVCSEFRRMVAIIPIGGYPLVIASQYSGLLIGVGSPSSGIKEAYFGTNIVSAELRKQHTARDRTIPRLTLDGVGPFLHLPYWMFLLAFLVTQYFLLPKSLPMTEEERGTD